MKILVFIFFTLLAFPLRGQHQLLFDEYKQIIEKYGAGNVEDLEQSEVVSFDRDLLSLLKKFPNNSESDFLYDYLKSKILKKRLALIEVKKSSIATCSSVINDFWGVLNRYNDIDAAYQSYIKIKPPRRETNSPIYTRLAMTRDSFLVNFWDEFSEDSRKAILDLELYTFDIQTKNKTIKEYSDFIGSSLYSRKGMMHHKSMDAFLEYYRLLTDDKDPQNIVFFKDFIITKVATHPFIDFLEDPDFKSKYNNDIAKANKWQSAITSEYFNADNLVEVVSESAPSEIAYLALLRLIKDLIISEKYSEASEVVELHSYRFKNSKYEKKIIEIQKILKFKNYIKSGYYGNRKIESLPFCSNKKDEIEYITNFQRGNIESFRIAPIPLFRTQVLSYLVSINKSKLDVKLERKFQPNNDPWTKIWSYGQKSKLDKDSVFQFEKSYLRIDDLKSVSPSLSADFFISNEHKIAFFVSLATEQRMSEIDTTSNNEYLSPYLVVKPDDDTKRKMFQEYKISPSFHGKTNGNLNTDIYYSVIDDGVFRTPKLLKGINNGLFSANTGFAERSPILDRSGSYLYFSSEGHSGLGGLDIFRVKVERDKNNDIYVAGAPENILDINTPFDELYYTKVNDTIALFSSNFEGDFNIYEAQGVYLKNIKDVDGVMKNVKKGPLPYNPPKPGEPLIRTQGELTLDLQCVKKSFADYDVPEGKVQILGRVFDNRGRLVPHARVTFTYNDGSKAAGDEIDLSDGDSTYYVFLDYNQRNLKVVVLATNIEGDSISGILLGSIDSLCKNNDHKTYGVMDVKVDPIPMVVSRNEPLDYPIFFETNQFGTFLNTKVYTLNYFDDLLYQLQKNKVKYQVVGFADVRGDQKYNCKLSLKRAASIESFLVNDIGMPKDRLSKKGGCKTDFFPDSDIEKYKNLIRKDYNLKALSPTELKWLSNRRVMIYLQYE